MSQICKTNYICQPIWYDYTYNTDSDWVALSSDDEQKENVVIPSNGPHAVDLNISCIIKDNENPLEAEESINASNDDATDTNVTAIVKISGNGVIGKKLEVTLVSVNDPDSEGFTDENEDSLPDDLTYQWVRQDDTNGTNATDISGATENTYELSNDDDNKYFNVKISYTDMSGNPDDPGNPVPHKVKTITSPSIGPVEPLTVGEIEFQIRDDENNWITPEEASYAVGASNLVRLPRANMPEMRILANGRSVFSIHGAI